MIKLAAFDLDGTLADTLADLAAAVNHALSKRGLPTYPVEDYRYFVGNGIDNLIMTVLKEHYAPAAAEQAKADFSSYYADHCLDFTRAYPGLDGLLGKLDDSGVMTAVISNKPHAFVPAILQKLYPDRRFTLAWGQQKELPRKPAPDALKKAMEILGVEAEETLYIGDSNVDVLFGHNAGVQVCGVSWGFRGERELREAGADVIVHNADELGKYVLR